ncbi:MAG: tRNA pseudouridine(38-40) synthase TruA [Muribaculaceae bacterium]|nr:tRNA pseudouridine(38-40) synthase TruA [Muribaculaceae bacterium]
MPRYMMRLAYNGSPFHGWQIQPNAVSVQQTIEDALSVILRCPISITGAGRTDTGVNAREMFAHFDFPNPVPESILKSLNRLIGRDIAIYEIKEVADNLHARFSAVSRTYKYFISLSKNPFIYPLSWEYPSALNVELMNKAAEILLKTDDFTSFAKLHADTKTNICRVTHAGWEYERSSFPSPCEDFSFLVFTITADRFLRNMVRAVVGTLLEVGRGKMTLEEFENVIRDKNRCAAGQSVPPQALYLWEVKY